MSDTDKRLYIAIATLHREKEIQIFFVIKVNKKNNVVETKYYQSV